MSYQSAYLNFELHGHRSPSQKLGEFQVTLEIKLTELLKGLFHAVFAGPRLIRKEAPGTYRSINASGHGQTFY